MSTGQSGLSNNIGGLGGGGGASSSQVDLASKLENLVLYFLENSSTTSLLSAYEFGPFKEESKYYNF